MSTLSRFSRVPREISSTENCQIYAPFCIKDPSHANMFNVIDRYNLSNNNWSRVTAIPGLGENRILKDFSMISLGHYIYIIGGRLCRKVVGQHNTHHDVVQEMSVAVLPFVHRYNIRTDTWDMCASMAEPRFDFACTVSNEKIYVAGGRNTFRQAKGISSTEVYDPALDQWRSLANMSTRRYKCVGVMWQGKIHVVGGFAEKGDGRESQLGPYVMTRSSVEVYDAQHDRWDFMARMWALDVPPNQIVAVDGKLFSSGDCFMPWKGYIEAYDEKQNIWNIVHGSHLDCLLPTSLSNSNWPPTQRLYLTMAPIGNQLYFLAGYRMPGEISRLRSEVHVFDTTAEGDGWKSFDPIEEEGEKELCGHCCPKT